MESGGGWQREFEAPRRYSVSEERRGCGVRSGWTGDVIAGGERGDGRDGHL